MISKNEQKTKAMVAADERTKIDRNVLIWLNQYPELPVATVTTETHLGNNEPGVALSTITSAYVNRSFIYGGYDADYDFRIVYRIKPGKSMDKSLKANELLNMLGDWCTRNYPELGTGIRVIKVTPTSQAETTALYEDGDEDHQIQMKITYERME